MPDDFKVTQLPGEARAVLDAVARPMTFAQLKNAFPDVTRSGPDRAARALVLLFHLDAVRWV